MKPFFTVYTKSLADFLFFESFRASMQNLPRIFCFFEAFMAFIQNLSRIFCFFEAFRVPIQNLPQFFCFFEALMAPIQNFPQILFPLTAFSAFGNNHCQPLIFIFTYAILIPVAKPAYAGIHRNPALYVNAKPRSKGLARRSPPINVPSVRDLPLVKQN